MTTICPHCGSTHAAEAQFCPATGKPLTGTQSPPQPVAPTSGVTYTPSEVASVMEKLLFMKPALRLISQGKFFRRVFSIALQVLAVIIGLAGLIGWIQGWRLISELPAAGILGGIIFQVLFVVAMYMVVHTLLIRAKDIAGLPDSEFTIIPIASIFIRLIGEVYACFGIVTAVGAGILIWFAGSEARSVLSIFREAVPYWPSFGGGTFVDGLVLIAAGVLIAFFVLVLFYLLSELVVVWVAIAKNTEVTRQIAEQYDKTKVTAQQ